MDPVLLADMIDRARRVRMTDEERKMQLVNFAYGNAHIENPVITMDIVRAACEKLTAR